MTETEWLALAHPVEVLASMQRNWRARKYRLFSCACCRRVWKLIADRASRKAIEMVEQYVDGLVGRKDVARARAGLSGRGTDAASNCVARAVIGITLGQTGWIPARLIAEEIEKAVVLSGGDRVRERQEQAELARHILGNPFRKNRGVNLWPRSVIQLADALYAGEDCSFAMHDALLEAGHAELAEHFQEKEHPKGCWALDLILGKH
jgi:hypothetical protein